MNCNSCRHTGSSPGACKQQHQEQRSLKNMLQDGWQDHANQVPETQSAQLVHKGCCGMLE
jgi:hypothetical protein